MAVKNTFLEQLNNRIFLLSESYIAVKSHEVSIEAQELRTEAKVLRKVRDQYLKFNAGSTPDH
jgi:hypothetical protein